MKRLILLQALVAGAFALFLAGCTTIETRITEKQAAYSSMSATDRALVGQGKIREGMSQDAVYIAWGAPNQRATGRNRGRTVETWIYFSTTAGDYHPSPFLYGPYAGFGYGYGYGGGFGYNHIHRSGRVHRHIAYDPFYDPFFYRRVSVVSYPERTVSFQSGRVISYQLLPAPRVY